MLQVPGGSSRRRRQGGRAQIPPNRTTTTAGIFHVWLGPAWPPYLNLVLHAAAANRRATFYFVGPPLPPGSAIGNVVSLDGRNGTLLRERIATHLGVSIRLTHRKMCDLKPTWPALFPELARLHEWVGFSDLDVVYGDLDGEIARLQEGDELLVPAGMYPQPLANGNLMLFRSTHKLLHAWERIPGWRTALADPRYRALDEWWGVRPSFSDILYDMTLDGNLVARPTARPLVVDVINLFSGKDRAAQQEVAFSRREVPLDGLGATFNATLARGRLMVERRGPCVCARDAIVSQLGTSSLATCAECTRHGFHIGQAGRNISRRVEVLGLHFMSLKRAAAWTSPAPSCGEHESVGLSRRGVSCTRCERRCE